MEDRFNEFLFKHYYIYKKTILPLICRLCPYNSLVVYKIFVYFNKKVMKEKKIIVYQQVGENAAASEDGEALRMLINGQLFYFSNNCIHSKY